MPELDRYSSFSIARDVEPTEALQRFHDSFTEAVSHTFSNPGTGLIVNNTAAYPDVTVHQTNVPLAKVYPLEKWRYTHFQLLVKPDERSRPLESARKRLYVRADKIINQVAAADEDLMVYADGLLTTVQPEYSRLGEEIQLHIRTDKCDAVILDEQNYQFREVIKKTGPGSTFANTFTQPALSIAIGRLPLEKSVTGEPYILRKRKLLAVMTKHLPLSKLMLGPARGSAEDAPRSNSVHYK